MRVRMVQRYAKQAEDAELRAGGRLIHDDSPRLRKQFQVTPAAVRAQRDAWARADLSQDAQRYMQG